jgi:membrane-associated phospholipid phosphatase
MYWSRPVRGFALRVAIIVVLPWFASCLYAQVFPQPTLLQPAHFLLSSGPADRCVLLPAKLCEGLPESQSNGSLNTTNSASSPSSSEPWTVRRILKRLAHDQGSIYYSPLRRINVKWDAAFVLGTAALVATDRHTIGIVSRENESISRNISNVGLYGTEAAAGAIFLTGLLTDNAHARETGFITGEALLNAYPVYVAMQLIAGRERPDQGAGHGRFFQDHSTNTSFPSGHSMFTWTMAAVIAHEYPRTWVKILVYATAASVSVARYTGREHFVSDTALGGFIGYFIGRHIFKMHCSMEFSERCMRP